jgi:hypothetical protein
MANVAHLKGRWSFESARISSIIGDIMANRDWTHNLCAASDRTALSGVDECGRRTLPGESAPRDLRGSTFSLTDLSETTGLADAALDHCTFENVQFYDASLTGSSLRYTSFCGGTSLLEAKLRHCDLRNADLAAVSLADADLRNSDLRGADRSRADLRGTKLTDVRVDDEPWWGFLHRRGRWTKFGGKFQSHGHLTGEMDASVRRRILAETEFFLFRREHPMLAVLWYLATNGGRSATRLGMWAVVLWLLFGATYAAFPVPRLFRDSAVATWLTTITPQFRRDGVQVRLAAGDAFYLSAVTITTLGYGDITPDPASGVAKFLVAAEAVLGIILISMFVALLMQTFYLSG